MDVPVCSGVATVFFAPFYVNVSFETDHFIKTGSGQAQDKLRTKKGVFYFSNGRLMHRDDSRDQRCGDQRLDRPQQV
jgi:hypothetical protein